MIYKLGSKIPFVLASLAFGAVAVPSHAALTYVNPQGNYGNERCLEGTTCSGGAYNNTVSIIHALEMDMGLAAGSITRVDDGLDQIWSNTINNGGQVMTRARYAADNLRLGYDSGAGYQYLTGNTTNRTVLVENPGLFSTDPRAGDFEAIGTASWTTIPLSTDMMFAFIMRDVSINTYWSSNNSGSGVGSTGYANSVNLNDHMVTYRISNDHYIIAWEDRPFSGADLDYNDFVAEVRFVTPVPVPAAFLMFGPALLGLLGLARRRAIRV